MAFIIPKNGAPRAIAPKPHTSAMVRNASCMVCLSFTLEAHFRVEHAHCPDYKDRESERVLDDQFERVMPHCGLLLVKDLSEPRSGSD